ncbi:unnamed protein product [Rhizophagus irregularis]|nr:unnamed protein product [Rhizophagus irregularis]
MILCTAYVNVITRDTLPHFPHSPSFIPVLKFYFSILLYLSLPLLSILKKLKRSHSYDNLSPFAKLTFLRVYSSSYYWVPGAQQQNYRHVRRCFHKSLRADYAAIDILFFILFAYAHSLMVLLSETSPDNGVNTFTGFYQSIKNTWLILLNDYSSLEPWTKNYLLDILMITFSLSTAIILFNVLIALVSNAYEETLKNAHTIWVIELAEIIAEIELNPLISYYLPTLRAESTLDHYL